MPHAMPQTNNGSTAPALEMLEIRKRFATLTACDGVSFRLAAGRVHGLLGENGAGKSTLMNVAYGMIPADSGEIRVRGIQTKLRSPADAIAAGIGMVHQHFMLAGAISVLDNVLLGDPRAGHILNRRRAAEKLTAMAEQLGLAIDPWARVSACQWDSSNASKSSRRCGAMSRYSFSTNQRLFSRRWKPTSFSAP